MNIDSHSEFDIQGIVLIVDDNPENLGFLFEYLEEFGFRVLVALGGEEALDYLTHVKPDLIMLDVMMPDIDGFETCARIKDEPDLRDIPVVFMSALTDPEDKVRGFDLGAVDYVTKPLHKEEVLARISTHISLRRLQSELKRRNAELERKRSELEERNEELDAFSHMVAHDLRNALNRVLGYSELIIDDTADILDAESREDLGKIRSAALQMQEVIDSLLQLASTSKDNVDLEQIEMGTVIARVQRDMEVRIRDSGAEIIVANQFPLVAGHRPWIERVWTNYIENGIKYGGRPPVLELGAEYTDHNMVRFWIRDNGPGISQEAQESIFRPFTRLPRDQGRASGHGLGLSIVQRVVKAMGGEVGARSICAHNGNPGATPSATPGATTDNGAKSTTGSEFYFTLPAL